MPITREEHRLNFPIVRRRVPNDLNSQALKPYPRWTPDEERILRETIRRLLNQQQEPSALNIFNHVVNWLEGWQRGIHAIARRLDNISVVGFQRDANAINTELARVALEEGRQRADDLRRQLEEQERINNTFQMDYQNEVFHLRANNEALRNENEQLAKERDRFIAQQESILRGLQGYSAYLANSFQQVGASFRSLSQAPPDIALGFISQYANYPVGLPIQASFPPAPRVADQIVEEDEESNELQTSCDN